MIWRFRIVGRVSNTTFHRYHGQMRSWIFTNFWRVRNENLQQKKYVYKNLRVSLSACPHLATRANWAHFSWHMSIHTSAKIPTHFKIMFKIEQQEKFRAFFGRFISNVTRQLIFLKGKLFVTNFTEKKETHILQQWPSIPPMAFEINKIKLYG
jgi:hypothetical protein